MIIKSFGVFESLSEIEKIKGTLKDIYADISDETDVFVSRLGDSGDIFIYEKVLALIGKKRDLNMHLYSFYQEIIKDRIFMVIIRDPKIFGSNLKRMFKEIESRALHENLHIIYEDMGESSRATVFLKDKEKVLQKLLSYKPIKESLGNKYIVSELHNILEDVSDDGSNVEISFSKSLSDRYSVYRDIVSAVELNVDTSIGSPFYDFYLSEIEGKVYAVRIVFNDALNLQRVKEIEGRCKKYLNLDVASRSYGTRGCEIILIENKDEIIKKLLSYEN